MHEKQKIFFPALADNKPWDNNTTVKRYYCKFPFYPFRTCSTRDLVALGPIGDFESQSPLFPAHTQLNITFKRRNVESLLNYMVPYNLNYSRGSADSKLTAVERAAALTFSVPNGAVFTDYIITGVEVVIKDIYLQVERGEGGGGRYKLFI